MYLFMSTKLYDMNIYEHHIGHLGLKLYLIDTLVLFFGSQIELF